MNLNITNGESFNNKLKVNTYEKCVPFNEAMIEGKKQLFTSYNLFSSFRAQQF